MWQGEDAFVIGGGDSLRHFDWGSVPVGSNTIACNSGFLLGHWLVRIVLFGDIAWWEKIGRFHLHQFGGIVLGCYPGTIKSAPPWLMTMPRWTKTTEFSPPDSGALGWMGNTGAMAINLALLLGARRVFLLGFDMTLGGSGDEERDRQANWHDLRCEPNGRQDVYPRFIESMRKALPSLRERYPGREVLNVSNVSKLELFPRMSLEDFYARKEQDRGQSAAG
jgi:hypothetical protein